MNPSTPNIIIIGAGLTGLTTAYLLKKAGIKATILEARPRIGGRIHTRYKEGEAAFELGATWLGRKHQYINALLQELGLPIHEQVLGETAIYEYLSTSPHQLVQLPPNSDPSYRIKGGSSVLIQRLAAELEEQQLQLGQVVQSITFKENSIQIQTNKASFQADQIISTLPPNLLVSSIEFSPALPTNLVELAKNTHTWMGESIKVGFTFPAAFWKTSELSGTIMSNVGPIGEMYDHSNVEATQFALKGFLNGAFHAATKEERQKIALLQLKKYYGEKANKFTTYVECVWRNEPYTFTAYEDSIMPHQNNGHPLFRTPLMDGRLIIAGSETAANFPGYMDGAVQSAYDVLNILTPGFQNS